MKKMLLLGTLLLSAALLVTGCGKAPEPTVTPEPEAQATSDAGAPVVVGDGERVLFEDAGLSMLLPEGWQYRDLTEVYKSSSGDTTIGDNQGEMEGYIMAGDTQGLLLISIVAVSNTPDSDSEASLQSVEKAYENGEWIEVDGVKLFTFTDDYNFKYVFGYTDNHNYTIYGEVLNEGFAEQFDDFIATFEFS